MLIPNPRIGPWIVREGECATLVVPVENGDRFDCLRIALTPARLAKLVAEAAPILRDDLCRTAMRQSIDFSEKSHDDASQDIEK